MASAVMAGWNEEAPEVDLDSYNPLDMRDGDDTLDDQIVEEEQGEEGIAIGGEKADTSYEQLLGRVFSGLAENHPDLAGRRNKPIFRPPNIIREAPKKRVFVNFMDACERQPKHVMDFLLSEMRTSGLLDGQQRLVVKGRFTPRDFEALLKRYTNKYVICNGCKYPDTTLSRESLRCEKCGFSRSVEPIKARVFR